MRYFNSIKHVWLPAFLCCTFVAEAQNNTSPYSILGIGDIEKDMFDRSSGMGGASVSLSSPAFIYSSNPASLGRLADNLFAFEVNGRFKAVNYKGAPVTGLSSNSATSSDIQIERLAVGIKVKKWWGASVGLLPFSTSNYSFRSKKDIAGSTSSVSAYYTGNGGLHQAYFSNAFNPVKNLSVGIQSSFLFGSFTQNEDLGADGSLPSIVTNRNIYLHRGYFKAGLLYDVKVNKKLVVSLGATASKQTDLKADYSLTVTQAGQAIQPPTNELIDNYFTLPVMYTTGISAHYDNKYKLAVEYQRQNWSDLNYKGLSYSLENSDRFSAGVEYSNQERYYLQGGFYHGNSYLRINNQQLKNTGFTMGFGVNTKRSLLSYQINFSVGQYGTTKNNLVKENYAQISLLLAYRDRWWTNVKRYD